MSIAEARALTGLFHEQQIGALCGQHVLNNLLQGPYVNMDALREIAQKLDHEEKEVLYNRPNEPFNLEEEGFSNIQVLQSVLKNLGIDLIPFNSKDTIAEEARARPDQVNAYVFNLAEHWFTVRKFGNYYFDLNSMYTVPHLLGCDDFVQFMSFVQNSGGSIFIVHGHLPDCEAEQRLNSPTFDPFKYMNIVERLPIYCVDRDLFVSLEGPGPDGKYILRVPPKIMDEYERNPDSPAFQKELDAILPPEAKGRVVLIRQTENQEVTLKTTKKVRRLLIIQKHLCDEKSCLKCQFIDNVSKFYNTMKEHELLIEQVLQRNHEAMKSRREATSRIERNLRDIEKHSTTMKLVDRMCQISNKLIEDTHRFEDIAHHLTNHQLKQNRSKIKDSDLLMIIDSFKQAFAARDTLQNDIKTFDEALDQYQFEQAVQESLSTMEPAAAPEPMKRKPPSTTVDPPTPPEDRQPLINTTSFHLTVPDSSLPTDDDPPSSLSVPESPPPSPSPVVPAMTIEELRILRRQKFGNRNVSLVSGIFSPTDP